jgi:hypothetical protein
MREQPAIPLLSGENRGGMLPIMRFYVFPKQETKTTYVNFDHVARAAVDGPNIEIYFVGIDVPLIMPKNATTLSALGKGMDLSDSSKEALSNS